MRPSWRVYSEVSFSAGVPMVSSIALPPDTKRMVLVMIPNPGRSARHSPASDFSLSKALSGLGSAAAPTAAITAKTTPLINLRIE
jgi:hypothetical protein